MNNLKIGLIMSLLIITQTGLANDDSDLVKSTKAMIGIQTIALGAVGGFAVGALTSSVIVGTGLGVIYPSEDIFPNVNLTKLVAGQSGVIGAHFGIGQAVNIANQELDLLPIKKAVGSTGEYAILQTLATGGCMAFVHLAGSMAGGEIRPEVSSSVCIGLQGALYAAVKDAEQN